MRTFKKGERGKEKGERRKESVKRKAESGEGRPGTIGIRGEPSIQITIVPIVIGTIVIETL